MGGGTGKEKRGRGGKKETKHAAWCVVVRGRRRRRFAGARSRGVAEMTKEND